MTVAPAEAEFDAFVNANLNGLLRTAFLIAWDEKEAEDLVQECLVKVARQWSRVGSMEQPVAYVRRVLINLALDDAKRRKRHRSELYEPAGEVGTEALDFTRLESRAELVAALRTLPPRQRAVIVLRYFLDLSEADTAQALDCSVGTVKSTTSKALARLRASLDPNLRLPEVREP
jgi:RNA polymerase sigma-70 factor (sigma-E family)